MSYHGFFWEFALHLKRTSIHHQLNWSMVHRSQFQVILLLLQTALHLLAHCYGPYMTKYKASCPYLHPNMARKRHLFLPICTAVSMSLFAVIVIDSPLKRPYEGPFKVIHSGPKVFTIDRGGKLETISIERLKPAHLDFDMPVPVPMPRPRGRPRKVPQTLPRTSPTST